MLKIINGNGKLKFNYDGRILDRIIIISKQPAGGGKVFNGGYEQRMTIIPYDESHGYIDYWDNSDIDYCPVMGIHIKCKDCSKKPRSKKQPCNIKEKCERIGTEDLENSFKFFVEVETIKDSFDNQIDIVFKPL